MTRAHLPALDITLLAAFHSPRPAMLHVAHNTLRGGPGPRLLAPLPGPDTPAPNASEVLP